MSRRSRGQPRVLLIDDEPDLLELLELTLSRMGLDTTRAETVADAIRYPRSTRPRNCSRRMAPFLRRVHDSSE